jgi:serine/threonine protein kinase
MISEAALDRLAGMLRAPDLSGTRYEIVAELGRGGMGIVYLARDTALDREIALKIVDRGAAGTRSDSLDALAHEARILARLEHPGIVPVHDFGELPDGRVYYAMKRVRGERFDRWLAAGRDLANSLTVFLRICDAVAFAHAHAVVHRDLKPENVMIGEFGEVLVLDWGIARTANREPNNQNREPKNQSREPKNQNREPKNQNQEPKNQNQEPKNQNQEPKNQNQEPKNQNQEPENQNPEPRTPNPEPIVGTPAYMSPEQRAGAAVDHRADIYALGVMLDALGGPASVAAIAAKARADDPAGRYQSVQELAADVQRFLSGRRVGAHREPLVDRVQRIYRRHRVPILLVLTYLAARVLLLWIGGI